MAEACPDREEFSDFALVLQDGRELPCHKVVLARESPFFRKMLKQDGEETHTNKMKVTEFEPATAESFLDFVFADLKHVPKHDMFKKDFDRSRLTTELLRMSHLYDMKILQDICAKHLKKNIVDALWSTSGPLQKPPAVRA